MNDSNIKKKPCNCCIEIEDSIVVIVCGEVDIDRLGSTLSTAIETKKPKQNYHSNINA